MFLKKIDDFNIILATDSYKMVHHKMYSDNTQFIYSYNECRYGSLFPKAKFFGLQIILKKFLEGQVVTREKIEEAKEILKYHFVEGLTHVNIERWEYILEKYDGKLPIRIKAVPEGTVLPISNVMFDVINTDEKCSWLVGHVESLLTHVWSTTTTATLSYYVKEACRESLQETCDDNKIADVLQFMLQDFGYRSGSNHYTSSWGGAANLLNFWGTDTLSAIKTARDYYNMERVDAYSVPASEHSVMTAEGELHENRIVRRIFDKFKKGIVSLVADSYNVYNFTDKIIGGEFKQEILERDGKVVIRPDSGDFREVIPRLLKSLDNNFGSSINSKGFKVLNPKVGLIWGDGLNRLDIVEILTILKDLNYSAENIVFGMGGGLIQKTNRDTMRNAFKSSAHCRDGIWYDVFKSPLDKSKVSKKGIQFLTIDSSENYITTNTPVLKEILEVVFLNGDIVKEYNFDEVIHNSPEYAY